MAAGGCNACHSRLVRQGHCGLSRTGVTYCSVLSLSLPLRCPCPPLTHPTLLPLIHMLIHSLTPSTHPPSLTHSYHSLTHSLSQSLPPARPRSLTHSFPPALTQSLSQSIVHTNAHSECGRGGRDQAADGAGCRAGVGRDGGGGWGGWLTIGR